jgi:hypothetical protein
MGLGKVYTRNLKVKDFLRDKELIRTYLHRIKCKNLDWINLALQPCALMNMVMHVHVSTDRDFLTR